MLAIYKKEIRMFFNSMEAYIAISVFFIINSIVLWYIPSEYNILYNNQASLLPFFTISPWVLLVLIPSITMKMINCEITQKTSLILFTKPIKIWEVIMAKFLASITIGCAAITPSLLFIYTIYQVGNPIGNIDFGELMGSYIGIILLIILYSAIGLFCSSIFKNHMIALSGTIMIILLLYLGVDFLSIFHDNSLLEYLSIQHHYESINRGVIDSRDIIYFVSSIVIFLYFTVQNTKRSKI